jgi:hypothetical protein
VKIEEATGPVVPLDLKSTVTAATAGDGTLKIIAAVVATAEIPMKLDKCMIA